MRTAALPGRSLEHREKYPLDSDATAEREKPFKLCARIETKRNDGLP